MNLRRFKQNSDQESQSGYLTVVSDAEVMERPVGPATLHTLADMQVELATLRAKLATQHMEIAVLKKDREQLYKLLTLRGEAPRDKYVFELEQTIRELQNKVMHNTLTNAQYTLHGVEHHDDETASSVSKQQPYVRNEVEMQRRQTNPAVDPRVEHRDIPDSASVASSLRTAPARLNIVSRQRRQNISVSPRHTSRFPVELESLDASSVQGSMFVNNDRYGAIRRGDRIQRRSPSLASYQDSHKAISSTPTQQKREASAPNTTDFIDDAESAYRDDFDEMSTFNNSVRTSNQSPRKADRRGRLSSKQSIVSAPADMLRLEDQANLRKLASRSHSHQIAQAAVNGTRPNDGRIHIPPTIKTFSAGAPMHLKPHISVDLF